MADVERRLIGWVAGHAAYTVLLATIFGVAAASAAAYLYLTRAEAPGLAPVARQVARLAFVDGGVRVKRVDSNEFLRTGEGVALGPGDSVQTADGAIAVLRFGDGTSYRLDPGMTLVLRDSATGDAAPEPAARLAEGRLAPLARHLLPPASADPRVATASGDAASVRRRIVLGTSPTEPGPGQPLRK